MNAWCEQTGDYDGLRLLRLYTLYRAVVRTKVALMSSNRADFKRYSTLSQNLIRPANPPRLILLHGLSGSGKSTVAAEIARAASGIRLRADVIRKRLFPKRRHNPAKLYSSQATSTTYSELARLCEGLLAEHCTVIVDATFLSQTSVDRFAQLAQRLGITPYVFECQAPEPVLRDRIKRRATQAQDPSDATPEVLAQQITQQKQAPVQWPVPVTTINTHTSLAVMKRHVRKQVRAILTTNICC